MLISSEINETKFILGGSTWNVRTAYRTSYVRMSHGLYVRT